MRGAWFWALLAAVGLAIATWVLLYVPPPEARADWHVIVSSAVLLGTPDDPHSYEGVVVTDTPGSGVLVVDNGSITLTVSVEIGSTAWLSILADTQSAPHRVEIELVETLVVWPHGPVYGDTAFGGSELPTTTAFLGGEGTFRVSDPTAHAMLSVPGTWSLAYAVRRSDGSIRQQGLYYSPLLRDKSGFSDTARLEFTLILDLPYNKDDARFTLVFRTLEIVVAPDSVTLP